MMKNTEMKYGICALSLIPQRTDPSEKSEMVNQLLLGDIFTVINEKESWVEVKCEYDGYTGWIDKKMAKWIDAKTFQHLSEITPESNPYLTTLKSSEDSSSILLSPGCVFYKIPDFPFALDETIKQKNEKREADVEKKEFITVVRQFLHTPYLWGGKSIFGIDCSGFVQVVYKIFGIKLPRDASEQSTIGETIGFIQEARLGDIAFFDNKEGNITHVGIILENSTIIHSSGCVRIDKIDSHGIFNSETNSYSHKLRIIKRVKIFQE